VVGVHSSEAHSCGLFFRVYKTFSLLISTGWPNKNRTFLRYRIFAATTDIITRFLITGKCSEITAENNKQQFV